ncbi:MAG: DNA alkylation repair protein [Chloroflexota bacterium]
MAEFDEVMDELRSLGTAQNVKIYRRHGAGEDVFGVSYADLGRLKKRLKVDHPLARALWQSGNHDARVLATMIADPAQMSEADLDAWLADLESYVLAGAVADLASQTPGVKDRMERWTSSDEEWVGRAGWLLAGYLAQQDATLPDAYFEDLLSRIEARLHGSKNRMRDAMNSAIIAIGSRNRHLEQRAKAVAQRIGKVEVDHGQTGCKTPDAISYIDKVWARKAA